ncbi:IS1595 family transposase [Edaphocola aurantiacus]|uniref:IS1595 family transposase n=1 Tax=Edaphocola aurantiacus TaxID=2601682 RepID=UPI0021D45D06|nr:IS1595 family transposase [Edaphocola aurantiacus]
MLHRIRNCSKFENMHKMKGVVEADETYVGGKNRNRHHDKKYKKVQGRSYKDKVPVFGLIERGGKVMARVVPSVKAEDLQPIICGTVELFSTVYTDEWGAYHGLGLTFDHSIVNHGRKQFENGDAHTNTIENFWGNLKRGIIGVYRVTSRKHLQKYLNEFVFKYNTRKSKPMESLLHLLSNLKGTKKTYRELVNC